MATRTNRGTDAGDDWKRFALAGGVLLLVLALLVVGATLQRDSPVGGEDGPTVTIERAAEGGTVAPPATEPAEPLRPRAPGPLETPSATPDRAAPDRDPGPAPIGSGGDLVARARRDTRRLADSGDEWTLQLLVACDADNAARRVSEAGDSGALYVLPRLLDGRSCYRLCWGHYGSRDAALAARDLPAALRASLEESPQPRLVADLLP